MYYNIKKNESFKKKMKMSCYGIEKSKIWRFWTLQNIYINIFSKKIWSQIASLLLCLIQIKLIRLYSIRERQN